MSLAVEVQVDIGFPVRVNSANPLAMSAAEGVKVGVRVFAFVSKPVPVLTIQVTDEQLLDEAPASV